MHEMRGMGELTWFFLGSHFKHKQKWRHPQSLIQPLMLWAYFLLEVLDIFFRFMASWILANPNR